MAEYIDREKILELISCEMEKQKREYAFSDGLHCGLERALGIVEDFPAADVAQVRHGKWEKIRNPYGNIEGWLCGCGREVKSKDKYCPNCGVKMDKEK